LRHDLRPILPERRRGTRSQKLPAIDAAALDVNQLDRKGRLIVPRMAAASTSESFGVWVNEKRPNFGAGDLREAQTPAKRFWRPAAVGSVRSLWRAAW
jgi:hypothetical protein